MGTTSSKRRAPREGAHAFNIRVHPSKRALAEAIEQGGACDPKKCWHKIAIFAIFLVWCPEMQPDWVKVDAGHVRVRYKGWWYIADQARTAKESLLLFDKELWDLLQAKPYTLNFRRQHKVSKKPDVEARERLNKINELDNNRRERNDYKNSMHQRVVGFAMI